MEAAAAARAWWAALRRPTPESRAQAALRAAGVEVLGGVENGAGGRTGTFLVEKIMVRVAVALAGAALGGLALAGTGVPEAAANAVDLSLDLPCEVAVEEFMACGVGVCWTCVVPVNGDGDVRYLRSCTEGPVFDGEAVMWG